jgi:hypothetical protein
MSASGPAARHLEDPHIAAENLDEPGLEGGPPAAVVASSGLEHLELAAVGEVGAAAGDGVIEVRRHRTAPVEADAEAQRDRRHGHLLAAHSAGRFVSK